MVVVQQSDTLGSPQNKILKIFLWPIPPRWLHVAGHFFAALAGALAFLFVVLIFFDSPNASIWLPGAGGLGALAFGLGHAVRAAQAAEARHRKLRATARLARRSCFEMVQASERQRLTTWIGQVGSSKSLDLALELLREVLHLAAEVGGRDADWGEQAFGAFITAADVINPLWVRRMGVSDSDEDATKAKDQIISALRECVDALDCIIRSPAGA